MYNERIFDLLQPDGVEDGKALAVREHGTGSQREVFVAGLSEYVGGVHGANFRAPHRAPHVPHPSTLPPGPTLLCLHSLAMCYVPRFRVSATEDVIALLEQGMRNRVTRATSMNEASVR